MKDFLKWLGVNEKIAKVAVWLLIFMVFLIIINTMFESVGLPNYMITVENIVNINGNMVINRLSSLLACVLNFYVIILLVFRIKDIKKFTKYLILYVVLTQLVAKLTNYAFSQIFIFAYILVFCFMYSKKNWKYVLYGIVALLVNGIVQYICYFCKTALIDLTSINQATKMILTLDYFIVMGIIILVKEIYLKKRRGI